MQIKNLQIEVLHTKLRIVLVVITEYIKYYFKFFLQDFNSNESYLYIHLLLKIIEVPNINKKCNLKFLVFGLLSKIYKMCSSFKIIVIRKIILTRCIFI